MAPVVSGVKRVECIQLTCWHCLFHSLRRKFKSIIWPATFWPERLLRSSAVHLVNWKCRNPASSCTYFSTRTLPVIFQVSQMKQCLPQRINKIYFFLFFVQSRAVVLQNVELVKDFLLKVCLKPGLNLTVFRGTGPGEKKKQIQKKKHGREQLGYHYQ